MKVLLKEETTSIEELTSLLVEVKTTKDATLVKKVEEAIEKKQ